MGPDNETSNAILLMDDAIHESLISIIVMQERKKGIDINRYVRSVQSLKFYLNILYFLF